MSSHRTAAAVLAVGLAFACIGSAPAQQEHATAQEVVQKVRQAAQAIAKAGEAGLATYGSKNDTSVWKDSYVFVVNCEGGSAVTAANPARPELKGQPTAQTLKFGPKPGERGAADFCTEGRKPHGGGGGDKFPKAGGGQPGGKGRVPWGAPGTPHGAGG